MKTLRIALMALIVLVAAGIAASGDAQTVLHTLDTPNPQADGNFGWSMAVGDVGDGYINDGCPAVGDPETDDECLNTLDDEDPETGGECANSDDDDADGLVNDGCDAVAAPENARIIDGQVDADGDGMIDGDDDGTIAGANIIDGGVDYDGDTDVDTNDDGYWSGPDVNVIDGGVDIDDDGDVDVYDDGNLDELCANSNDDDGDGATNDGCPPYADGKVNDGCPAVGDSETGAQCDNDYDDELDGIADIVVGAPYEDVGGNEEQGRVYVFSGADGSLIFTLDSPNPEANGYFGYSVAVGDVGDGYINDGCPAVDAPESACADNVDDDGDTKVNDGCPAVGDPETGAQCDNSVDDELDGKADIAVGALGEGYGYVFSGADGSQLFTWSPFGWSVAMGDVNGDGHADIAVGSPMDGDSTGSARVFSGADGSQLFLWWGGSMGDCFGYSVAVGDVNGDGYADIALGVPAPWGGPGEVAVRSGADGSELFSPLESPNAQTFDEFGYSVAVGDVNGGGRADIAVGAPGETVEGAPDSGRAYVFSGADGLPLWELENPDSWTSEEFGSSLAAGDVDGDGLADIVVGAPLEWVGDNHEQGRAYVFSTPFGSLLFSLDSPNPLEHASFGHSLAVVDTNGDGYGEVAVGAPGEAVGGNFDQGRAYVLSGDRDGDGDGVPDVEDNCPTVANGPNEEYDPGVGNQTDSDDQCDDIHDNDFDGKVNDGCPMVGDYADCDENTNGNCDDPDELDHCGDNVDSDGDTKVNDGCPAYDGTRSEDGCGPNTCWDEQDNGPDCDGAGSDGIDYDDPDCRGGSGGEAHDGLGDACDTDDDNDGLADEDDVSCRTEPEDYDGYEDDDGCPDPDNDMDGICDPETIPVAGYCFGWDECAYVPEDIDAWQDWDGCPEADNDGDGHPDATDFCPGTDWTAGPDGIPDNGDEPLTETDPPVPMKTKEDYDGVIDWDGCHDSPGDDWDSDGISDEVEVFTAGTDPTDMDTDNDGLCDGHKLPLCASEDANNNGIVDPGETDPTDPDTDGDGLSDGLESGLSVPETPDTDISSPNWQPDADPASTTDPLNADSDGDGVDDGAEDPNHNGRVDPGETAPGDDDTDDDTFLDGVELYLPTDPTDKCSDDPGVHDAWPLDINIDRYISVVGDVLEFRGHIGAAGGPPPDPNWLQRLDLNMDNYLNVVGDVLMFRGNVGDDCT